MKSMRIDIANKNVKKMEYHEEGQLCSRLYLYSPDRSFGNRLCRCYEQNGFNKEAEQLIADDETEVSYIHINYTAHEAIAFRSITSHYELFYSELPNGEGIITDHMRNMLSVIPVAERHVSLEGVCDTTLFQHNYSKDTYIRNVYRLGCGELLIIDDRGFQLQQAQFLEFEKYNLKNENGEKVIEYNLRRACDQMIEKNAINTLSGGVDSTLTHIIMGNPKSVSGNYEHEGFLPEKEYALEAASMLNADHTFYNIKMNEYMDKMKGVSMNYAMPPFNLTAQVMHYTIALHIKNSQICVSELGGTFGGPHVDKIREKTPMADPHNWANMNSSVVAESEQIYLKKIFGLEMIW